MLSITNIIQDVEIFQSNILFSIIWKKPHYKGNKFYNQLPEQGNIENLKIC